MWATAALKYYRYINASAKTTLLSCYLLHCIIISVTLHNIICYYKMCVPASSWHCIIISVTLFDLNRQKHKHWTVCWSINYRLMTSVKWKTSSVPAALSSVFGPAVWPWGRLPVDSQSPFVPLDPPQSLALPSALAPFILSRWPSPGLWPPSVSVSGPRRRPTGAPL